MSTKHRILIVDDEPLNVKLLAAILSADSYDIISAFNGEQALEKVNEACPDLILLDIMMPGIDGFEVIRRLKDSFETKDIHGYNHVNQYLMFHGDLRLCLTIR